jgi:hypothetical protein
VLDKLIRRTELDITPGDPMLVDANTGRPIKDLPYPAREELLQVLNRLEQTNVAAMERQIKEWALATGNERTDFFASNWLTGNDWKTAANGVFEPLYEACEDYHENPVQYAGWMFGWLVRRVMIELCETEDWCMYKNPEAGETTCARNMWGTFYWHKSRN